MNFRTVVIIALLALAGYRFIPPAAKSLDRSLGKAAGEEDSEPVREVSYADLATLHGRVEATEKDAVVIRCTSNTEFRVNRTAEAASRLEFQTYGPLMEMSSAGLRRALWRPALTAVGTVRLEGYPREGLQTGSGVHVVAVPVSAGRYSVRYSIHPNEPSPLVAERGAWMWNKPEVALERKPERRSR